MSAAPHAAPASSPVVLRHLSSAAAARLLGAWHAGGPAYVALADALRSAVLSGTLSPNTRLPSEHELAAALRVSRTTTSGATAVGHLDLWQATPSAPPELYDSFARALDSLPAYLDSGGYEPYGLAPLREAVAARYRERGVPTTADEILVTTGAQQAIARPSPGTAPRRTWCPSVRRRRPSGAACGSAGYAPTRR